MSASEPSIALSGADETERAQEAISAPAEREKPIAEQTENPQADIGLEPFPRPHPEAAAFSPTPSTTSPYPVAEDSVAGSAGTPPELSNQAAALILGCEDNAESWAALDRGPPDWRIHPEDSQNGGLVQAALTLMRLQADTMTSEEGEFRGLIQQIWADDEVTTMTADMIQTPAAIPTNNELQRYDRAMRGLHLERGTNERDGGLMHAAMTVIRLNGAEGPQVAREVRQLAAQIWTDSEVQAMITSLLRVGKDVPSAREEMSFENARRGDRPGEGDETELEEDPGQDG